MQRMPGTGRRKTGCEKMRQQRVDPPGLMRSCAAFWWQVGQGRARREVGMRGARLDGRWMVDGGLALCSSPPRPLSPRGEGGWGRGAICKALTGRRRGELCEVDEL